MADDAKPEPKPFQTAAEAVGIKPPQTQPTPGLSQSPGLKALPDSQVPGLAGGGMVSHVVGPQQAPVDPIAAGLDTKHDPLTRAENRAVTQTGVLGAGPRPSTYAEKGGEVVQAAPADGRTVAAPPDRDVPPPPGSDAELKPASEAVPQHETPDGAQRNAADQEQPPAPAA